VESEVLVAFAPDIKNAGTWHHVLEVLVLENIVLRIL
jgi:hypothetical protein